MCQCVCVCVCALVLVVQYMCLFEYVCVSVCDVYNHSVLLLDIGICLVQPQPSTGFHCRSNALLKGCMLF